jgi:Flp pilus assembly protein TadD
MRSGRSLFSRTRCTRQPNDRDLLSGLALYTAQAGQREAALAYAKRLVALDPKPRVHATRGAPRRSRRH